MGTKINQDENNAILWLGKEKPFLDAHGMKLEMDKWTFPLHFIDFETSAVTISFNKGRKPYKGIAFQFSHHTILKDGVIEHIGEYLSTECGIFPNYEFANGGVSSHRLWKDVVY